MGHEIMKAILWAQYLEGMGTHEDFTTAIKHLERQEMSIVKREGEQLSDEHKKQLMHIPEWQLN